MTLEQLIASFRVDADDLEEPFLFKDEWVSAWLSEAQAEAAIRGRLILEDANPAVCQIAVTAGQASYELHRCVYEIADLRFVPTGQTTSVALPLVSREWLDDKRPGWRDLVGTPECAIQTDRRIRLVGAPDTDGVLHLEAYRTPLKTLENDIDKPELAVQHHRHLVNWALYRAFSRPGSETIDPQRAELALSAFTRYFGLAPDSDARRATRHDLHQVNALW